jgi:hypothetical protein
VGSLVPSRMDVARMTPCACVKAFDWTGSNQLLAKVEGQRCVHALHGMHGASCVGTARGDCCTSDDPRCFRQSVTVCHITCYFDK